MLQRLKYFLRGEKSAPRPAPPDDDFRQLSFTFAVIALSARVACMDGPLTPEKYIAFRESFPLKGGICGKIRSLFALACENPTPYLHYVMQIKLAFPERRDLFLSLVERLLRIASVGGAVSPETEAMLAEVAYRLDINAADYAKLQLRYLRPKAHQVLGVARRATAKTLKQRYRELMQRYHPDRFASDELSPEVALLLQLKTSEINEAYRILSKKAA